MWGLASKLLKVFSQHLQFFPALFYHPNLGIGTTGGVITAISILGCTFQPSQLLELCMPVALLLAYVLFTDLLLLAGGCSCC